MTQPQMTQPQTAQAEQWTATGGIDLVEEGGVPVLRLHGEVDTTVVEAWDAGAAPGSRRAEAVDLSRTTFLDCRGLRLLVRETAAARRAGRLPELRRPSSTVRRLVEATGASPLFTQVG
ncbi:STAS domain-containing protein [Modestobacter roseus]|uniref:Anti-anti-sigma factor n=1 Tax=Modestobacter roseus TaxID=1181884 RepID=A0A562INZ6_9ACTN|nr:STAS domain-containing protein [Modestobacter roseus]TWH72622.1 anti-anti-sigma factor [Modestobacter roseus]